MIITWWTTPYKTLQMRRQIKGHVEIYYLSLLQDYHSENVNLRERQFQSSELIGLTWPTSPRETIVPK